MLSFKSNSIKLLMNILTIINTTILTLLILVIYYMYVNKEQIIDYIKNQVLELVKDIDLNKVIQNPKISNLFTTYYNKDQDQSPF